MEAGLNKTIRDVPPNNLLKFSDEDNLFLLGHSDSLALVTGGLGVLTPDTEAPVVTETTVGTNLLQTLEVLTKLVVEDVGHHLGSLAVLDVALPVEEPIGDLVLAGGLEKLKLNICLDTGPNYVLTNLHDGDQLLNLLLVEFSGSPAEGDVCLLQAKIGVTTTNTLDRGQGEHDASLSIDVGVKNTKNVLEVGRNNQRHLEIVA